MNVLADRHHAGLFHSLQLMAARFGWTLYTPKGMDWWDEWYWIFGRSTYNDDRLAQQFLEAADGPDSEFPDWPIDRVTLNEARVMPWDYVIATAQDNQSGFAKFAKEHGAQFVVQVGNTGQQVAWHLDPIALVSSETPIDGRGVQYHQQMDPIAYREPTERRTAASFVNCMSSMGYCYELLAEAQSTGLQIAVYGIDGQEIVKPYSLLLDRMAKVGWGWHDKAQGDGFGHVIHSWAAVGRPLIGHASHYAGKMAERFWRDGETCIDLDRHSIPETVEMVRGMAPEWHELMCRVIRHEYEQIDWDGEAAQIADVLTLRAVAA